MTVARWLVVAVALTAGCKRTTHSSGTCDGAVGRVSIKGPLAPASAYHVDPAHDATPAMLRLDCGGKLVLVGVLPKRPDAVHRPLAIDWTSRARPALTTGSFEAALDENKVLRGKTELKFEDGSASTIQFALEDGEVPMDEKGVNVSLIPGRITFTEQ